jgi:hypothetical protein
MLLGNAAVQGISCQGACNTVLSLVSFFTSNHPQGRGEKSDRKRFRTISPELRSEVTASRSAKAAKTSFTGGVRAEVWFPLIWGVYGWVGAKLLKALAVSLVEGLGEVKILSEPSHI